MLGQANGEVASHEGQHDEGVDDSLVRWLLAYLVAFVIICQYKMEESVGEVTAGKKSLIIRETINMVSVFILLQA